MSILKNKDWVFGAALLVSLALLIAFVFQGMRAARGHYETAYRILDDYSQIAAVQLANQIKSNIGYWAGHRVTQKVTNSPDSLAHALTSISEDSEFPTSIREGLSTAWTVAHDGIQCVRSPCPESEEDLPAIPNTSGPFAFAGENSNEGTSLYVTIPRARRVHWIGYSPSTLQQMLSEALWAQPVLPSVLADRIALNEALRIRLVSTSGAEVFRFGDVTAATTPRVTLDDGYGGLLEGYSIYLELDPSVAPDLVIGGLPQGRFLLMALLALLTVGLTFAVFRAVWRDRQLSRQRAEFVARVSHELRTPLAQIRLFCETLLLNREPDAGRRRYYLEVIERESQRLGQLVDTVLAFARTQSAPDLEMRNVCVSSLLHELVATYAPLAQASNQKICVREDLKLTACADPAALRQALMNLLDNALKFGPEGQTIEIGAIVHDSWVTLTVSDRGPGIPTSEQERIWRPFERGSEHGPASRGTGLGLAVTREIVQRMGGSCHVSSVAGDGAVFEIRLRGHCVEDTAG